MVLTLLMKHCQKWILYLVYIYNSFLKFILNFLTFLFLTSFGRFVCEDRVAADVRKDFFDMLKSQMWRNS